MEYSTREEGNVVVIELQGDVDAGAAPQLRKVMQDYLDEGKNQMLVDLAGVGFIDSSGLGIFVNTFKRVNASNGALKFARPPETLLKLFSLTKTDRIFEIFGTIEEGLASFD